MAVGTAIFSQTTCPKPYVITMGMIAASTVNLENKKLLIRGKAYDALPPGGAFVAVESG